HRRTLALRRAHVVPIHHPSKAMGPRTTLVPNQLQSYPVGAHLHLPDVLNPIRNTLCTTGANPTRTRPAAARRTAATRHPHPIARNLRQSTKKPAPAEPPARCLECSSMGSGP